MGTFSALLALCSGNSAVAGEFPAQRPVTRSFDVFFDLRLKKNGWVNNREAGDLRRHRSHYDVIVMRKNWISSVKPCYCPTRSQYPTDIFNWHELTLIPAWIKSYIHYALWHEITYPFPKFNGCTSFGMPGNFAPHFLMEVFTYPWEDWS